MVWARFSDDWADQPAILTLPAPAFRVYVESVLYASKWTTDGVVPTAALRPRGIQSAAAHLTAAGLWQAHDQGSYYLPLWREHVPPRAELEKARDATAERQRRRRRPEEGSHE